MTTGLTTEFDLTYRFGPQLQLQLIIDRWPQVEYKKWIDYRFDHHYKLTTDLLPNPNPPNTSSTINYWPMTTGWPQKIEWLQVDSWLTN